MYVARPSSSKSLSIYTSSGADVSMTLRPKTMSPGESLSGTDSVTIDTKLRSTTSSWNRTQSSGDQSMLVGSLATISTCIFKYSPNSEIYGCFGGLTTSSISLLTREFTRSMRLPGLLTLLFPSPLALVKKFKQLIILHDFKNNKKKLQNRFLNIVFFIRKG